MTRAAVASSPPRPPGPRRAARAPAVARHAALLALALALLPAAARGFGLEDVSQRAEALAAQAYQEQEQVPAWLREISYDQWRDIRFVPDDALWRGKKLPFQVQFFHPGLYYDRTVAIHVVEGSAVRTLAFSPDQFDYGRNPFASRVPQNLGYAGFRVHAPIKKTSYYDEVIVFLGASYFRAVGKDETFGLSARGLAVDTALSSGEEFPAFREFWLVTPKARDKQLRLYALLDSPSVTGAYQFVVEPGSTTTVAVDARLFMRRAVKQLGIAPLTSMFYLGENSARMVEDFRPEVHDSDGLLVQFGSGEWLWRPLDNPRQLRLSALRTAHPRGFGLIQRDREFDHYQDLETRAEQRPSAWVAPHGDWGEGQVQLVEIPTKSDTNDNIVAFWVPGVVPDAGGMAAYSYSLYWYGAGDGGPASPSGRVEATRRDRGTVDGAYRYVLDFTGKKLQALPDDTVLRGVVSIASGEDTAALLDQQVVKNPVTGGWRLTFQVRPLKNEPVELRAFLDQGGNALTETWSDVISP